VLPAASAIFHGRQKELGHVLPLLEQQEQVAIAILGSGGIGKTSVALSIMHHESIVKKYEQRRYFVACDAISTVGALNERFGQILGLGEKKPLVSLRRLAEEVHQPILVTLDNFETPWEAKDGRAEVESFLSDLASIPLVSVIVTLRGAERPAGVAWTRPFLPPITPLDLEAAIEVFTSIADTLNDDPHMIQLIRAVDHIPLAITLLAHQAQYTPCRQLFESWTEQKTRMVSRGAPFDDGRLSSLEVSIGVSLDSPRFKQETNALRLLQLISVLPDGASEAFLSSMTVDGFPLRSAIAILLRVSLAVTDSEGILRALSPVREYISSHSPISQVDLQTGFDQLEKESSAYLARWGTDESWNVQQSWRDQSGNIMSFVREGLARPQDIRPSASTEMALRLRSILFGYTSLQPLDSLLEVAYEAAYAAAHRTENVDPDLMAIHGALRLARAEVDNLDHLNSLVQAVRDHGDPEMLAVALDHAAGIACYDDKSSHTVISYAKNLLLLDIAKISLGTMISSYTGVAMLLRGIGQATMALDMLRIAKTVADTRGLDSRFTAEIDLSLAKMDAFRGCYSQGRGRLFNLLKGAELSQRTGVRLLLLMTIASSQGQLDEAEKAGLLSYQIFNHLGLTKDWGCTSLSRLYIVYLSQGRIQDALSACSQYRYASNFDEGELQQELDILKLTIHPTLRMSPSPETLEAVGKGDLFHNGELLYRLGRMRAAFRTFILALIGECSGGYRLGVSMLFLRIGDYFRICEEDMGTAESCYLASLQMIDFIGTPIHQADALARISLCQRYYGNIDAAGASISEAYSRLSRVGMEHHLEVLKRKASPLAIGDKQSFFSIDALPLPTLIGSWHFVNP
jgi:hypothetical protein